MEQEVVFSGQDVKIGSDIGKIDSRQIKSLTERQVFKLSVLLSVGIEMS